jgi:hypothetical protein
MTEMLNNGFTKLWDFIDQRGVVRRLVLFVSIWMLYIQSMWAHGYALTALSYGASDMSVAATVGAISAPATMLVGYVFKHYVDSRTQGA